MFKGLGGVDAQCMSRCGIRLVNGRLVLLTGCKWKRAKKVSQVRHNKLPTA